MEEACQLPVTSDAAPGAPAGAAERERLEALRRFHLGDRGADCPAPPVDVLPAALHPYRGSTLRGGWPMLVVPGAGDDRFARPLDDWFAEQLPVDEETPAERVAHLIRRVIGEIVAGEDDLVAAIEAVAAIERGEESELPAEEREALADLAARTAAAVPASARLVPLGRGAPLVLLEVAARRRLERARTSFAETCAELAAGVAARLAADRDRRPDASDPEERVGRMGVLGARFFDPGEVSSMVTQRRSGEPLDSERRKRLEEAGERLGRFASERTEPLWIVPDSVAVELDSPVQEAADPCAASAELFDQLAAAVTPSVAAARLARLETTDSFDPERHPSMLDRLDAGGFDPAELALVPPVLVVVRESDLLRDGLESLSRLLRSGRPVQIVVLAEESARGTGAMRFEPAYFGIAHREAYVHQGSTARPAELAAGFLAALDGSRPALHVIDAPSETPADLDRAVVAAARLSGRVAPIFRYEPQAGSSWARRMHFEANPAPDADWPVEPLPEGAVEYGAPATAPFTFADAVLLEPGRRAEFTTAGIESDDLVGFADWLTLDRTETARRLPFVWGVDAAGRLSRLVVSRTLAEEARGRVGFWRTLEELAGVRNEHVEAAVARARADAEQTARRATEELVEAHRAELERVRQGIASEVVRRLVAGLLGLDRAAVEALADGTAPAQRAGDSGSTDATGGSESGSG